MICWRRVLKNNYADPPLKEGLESYKNEIELFEKATELNDVKYVVFTLHGPNSCFYESVYSGGRKPNNGNCKKTKKWNKENNEWLLSSRTPHWEEFSL